MKNISLTGREWVERILLAFLFVAIGSLIIIVFSPLRPLLDPVRDYIGRISLSVILLIAVVLLRRSDRYKKFCPVMFGLLTMSVAVSLDWIISIYLIEHLGITGNTPLGFALLKLNEFAIVVSMVILFTMISGSSLGSIYIQKGNLKLGLGIGLIAFVIGAAGSIPMATLIFKGENLTLIRIIPWLPWLLIFVLANASQEELLFRGLFLQKLEPSYGKFISNFLIVFVFTGLHGMVTYTSDQVAFFVVLITLAFAWGYVIQRTNSLWGSILFHAGMDIPLILGIFSNLP